MSANELNAISYHNIATDNFSGGRRTIYEEAMRKALITGITGE